MAVLGHWRQFVRVREEASFNAATPGTAQEWNHGLGGALGWIDAIDALEGAGLQSNTPLIHPSGKVGARYQNNLPPVAGAQEVPLGSLAMPVIPDMFVRWLASFMATNTITPTAGGAALSSTAFASVATLDTQPNSLEVLVFTIASSTAASAASINIIQDGVTVEVITIGTSGSAVNGVYYSKGAYDGSVDAITFTVAGTVTSGMVVISGIDYTSQNFKFHPTSAAASLVIEQANRVEEGAGNSEFFPGCKIPTCGLAFDRDAPDSLLLATLGINGLKPTVATSTTYAGDAIAGSDAGYLVIPAWTASIQIDDVAYAEVTSANLNLNSNDEHFATASGTQAPTGVIEGLASFDGQLTIKPTATSRWDDYLAATSRKLEIEFLTPHMVNGSTPYQFKITSNNCYIETYTRANQGAAQSATIGIRGVYNSTDAGPVQIDLRSRMPV